MLLVNEKNLIVEFNFKLVLIDVKNKTIQKVLKLNIDYYYGGDFEILSLNYSTFIIKTNDEIYQYDIKDSKFVFIGKSELKAGLIAKYPNNKLILYNELKNRKNITISGM